MWKKLMFGIIIGVMLMTVSTGVIYGAQINPSSSAASSLAALACSGKGDGNGANQNGTGGCNGTGICDGTGECINENCTGDCNEGLFKQNGQNDNAGNCDGSNCPNLQNGQIQKNNANEVGMENKKAEPGSGYSKSFKYKYSEQYRENNNFRHIFARFLSIFKFSNNS